MGPARAAVLFRGEHPEADKFQAVLYGSLSKTGRGHGTDRAIRDAVAPAAAEVIFSQEDPKDMKHPNTMDLVAFHGTEELGRIRVQSIGGGDIVIEGREQELESEEIYMENSFAEILQFCQYRYVDLVEYIEMNEGPDIWDYLIGVWHVMKRSVEEGLSRTGELPGGLHIQRKAKYMFEHIVETKHPELVECQKVCSYAYAVSEQNADNGTIVTAPTCGSCGVLPAVLYYFRDKRKLSDMDIAHALGVAGLFGELAKRNASVSGAECGCQAEVGVACSMAAAAACQAFGYNIHQIEYAAEVSLEHHLGLTCDPICGLVQVPCIERNAMGAVKAINAARMALRGDGRHFISLDKVIRTMRQTGADMKSKYKETARGGLAVNIIEC